MNASTKIFFRVAGITLASALMVLGATVQAHGLRDRAGGPSTEMLENAKARLGLNAAQAAQFDAAVAAGRSAREAARTQTQPLRDQIRSEFASASPDLRKIAALRDQLQAARATTHKQMQTTWLAFYDTLSDAQKQIARGFMQRRLEGFGPKADRGQG